MGADILLKEHPVQSVFIDGERVQINYGFKTGIKMDIIYHDKNMTEKERILKMMSLFYGSIPDAIEDAMHRMFWFYTRGQYEKPEKDSETPQETDAQPKRKEREFCFKQDSDLILSAYMSEYGLFLSRMKDTDLHWWEFMALFAGLPEETLIKKYIYYRTVDISEMSKEEQKRIKLIRAQIRVREKAIRQQLSPEEKLKRRNEEWLKRAKAINQGAG